MSDFYTVKDQTLRNINAKQYVSGQITIDMMEDISNLGITLIINNSKSISDFIFTWVPCDITPWKTDVIICRISQ